MSAIFRKVLLVCAFLAVVVLAGSHWGWSLTAMVSDVRALGPMAFFAVFTVLILCGVPATPFLLVAGVSFPFPTTALGLAFSFLCAISAARLVFRYLLVDLVAKILTKMKISLDQLPLRDHAKLVLLVRITPGLPFSVQNCILVATKIPFSLEIAISWPVLYGWAMTYAFLGRKLATHNIGGVISAGGLILLLMGGLLILRKQLAANSAG